MTESLSRARHVEPIAHVRIDASGEWLVHALDEHLKAVSLISAGFAQRFGNADWGATAGILHDLGKYKADFQDYIRNRSGFERDEASDGGPGKVDHTAAGALHAVERFGPLGRILAYLIAGHHSGLPDWYKLDAPGRSLSERLNEPHHLQESLAGQPPTEILSGEPPTTLPCAQVFKGSEHAHLWVRMLFSCLVDADFLDTEAFMDPQKSQLRDSPGQLLLLKSSYDAFMQAKQARADDTSVNRLRRQILQECLEGASKPPGLFSLTVPTGGGKTLASIGFALEHALRHGKQRIIVAIPYTSIIEQTAQVLREVFGDDAVLEHHSNLDPERETVFSKLATENWDAPIVVTTNVQLFESLFAARTSACRKLHNIVNSVIILDEAQMLPVEFLKPVLSAITGLQKLFGVSVVLCTATQPALAGHIGDRPPSSCAGFEGLRDVHELMGDPERLAASFKRVQVRFLGNQGQPVEWATVAHELTQRPQVLAIVNSRRDCRELHALMPDDTVHLSALMCGEHRSKTISTIKETLRRGSGIRVVSTQLVEAGVDLDFPVVYRSLAGLDSIAQAAGRCNREGRLANGMLGDVYVFTPPRAAPLGLLRKGEDTAKELVRCEPDLALSLSPRAFTHYFQKLYGKLNSFDEKDIMGLLAGDGARDFQMQFRTAAMKFRLVDDAGQKAIIVWYKARKFDSKREIEALRVIGPKRSIMRKLQRCTVTIPEKAWIELRNQGAIENLVGPEGPLDLWAQCVPGLYDETFGLRLEGPSFQGDEFVC